MKKQPEYHKYNALEEWFRTRPASTRRVRLTFAEVEKIIGEKLPKSATKLKTWWTNLPPAGLGLSPRNAWLRSGWLVDSADQEKGIIKFKRK